MDILHRIRSRAAVCALALMAVFLALPGAAHAAGDIAPVVDTGGHVLVLSPSVVKIITGVLLPFVVALVVKLNASAAVKAVVGIIVAGVAATIERAIGVDGQAVFDRSLLVDAATLYGVQLLSYLGLWQHVTLNAKIAPTVGIG